METGYLYKMFRNWFLICDNDNIAHPSSDVPKNQETRKFAEQVAQRPPRCLANASRNLWLSMKAIPCANPFLACLTYESHRNYLTKDGWTHDRATLVTFPLRQTPNAAVERGMFHARHVSAWQSLVGRIELRVGVVRRLVVRLTAQMTYHHSVGVSCESENCFKILQQYSLDISSHYCQEVRHYFREVSHNLRDFGG